MSNEASRLLRGTETEENIITCIECGSECSIKDDLCPTCGQIPKYIQLKDLGKKLPIGLLEVVDRGGKTEEILQKDFDVIAIDWNVERDISETWKKIRRQPGVSVLDYIVCVLVHTVTSLAGMNFRKHKPERRMAILNNMFGGDIFYMYTWARIMSLGEIFTLKGVECQSCPNIFDYPVDLNTLDVGVRNDPKSLYKSVTLRDGFEISGEVRRQVKMRPSTFISLSHAPDENEAEMFAAMIKDAVVGIEGLPDGSTMTDSDIHRLSKWDMSILSESVDLVAGGPLWHIEGNCQRCNSEFEQLIDWRYTNFFRQSSRFRVSRKRSKK
jgi:hypothetical protein